MARLINCLVEEAEAAPETLIASLRLVVFLGHPYTPDLLALSAGPYGEELWNQAIAIYRHLQWPKGTDVLGTPC